jgi:hypothetical protein
MLASHSYAGCLIENVNSLSNQMGYGANPTQNYAQWRLQPGHATSTGALRLDFVAFSYHHGLAGIIDNEALRKEIQIHKVRMHARTHPANPPTHLHTHTCARAEDRSRRGHACCERHSVIAAPARWLPASALSRPACEHAMC